MPKAYSYLRFSTPEQRIGDSTRRQSNAASEWCARRGIELDTTLTFQDLGRSGFTGDNYSEGALGLFFKAVESGVVEKGSYLVIEALDRFSRENPMEASTRLFALVRAGITLVTTDDGQEYSATRLASSDPSLMLMLVVKMSQAHLESVRKSELVGKAWRQKKALARSELKPLTKRCPEWLELKDGKFCPRPDRVSIVRRIFDETIAGMGRREIARRLNLEGIPPFRHGTGWHTSSIAKITSGRAVLGEYQPKFGTRKISNRPPDGDPIPNYYPQIIDEQTYWRAQSSVSGRRQDSSGRRGREGAHILRGLARCTKCNGPMYIVNKGKPPKGARYFACSRNMRDAGCGNSHRWRVDALEASVLTSIGFVDANAFAAMDNATPAIKAKVSALQARLDDADMRRKRLMTLFETGDDAVRSRFDEVAKEYGALKKELKAAKMEASKVSADPGLVSRLMDAVELSKSLTTADDEAKRELRIRLSEILRGLIVRIDCDPDIGAVMILKPRLSFRLDGTVPYAFQSSARLVTNAEGETIEEHNARMLLKGDANDDEIARFIGADKFGRQTERG